MGFMCQTFSYTVITPIYCSLHIFTSPTASPSASARDVLPADAAEPRILLLSNAAAFFVPCLGMALPAPSVVSAATHYNSIAIWQFFPLLCSLFQRTATRIRILSTSRPFPSPRPVVPSTAVVYRAVLAITVTSHLALWDLALTPSSAIPPTWPPTASKILADVTVASAILPPSLYSPPSVVDMAQPLAPLAHFFLIWDVYCGSVALLLWAAYLRRAAAPPAADGFGWTELVTRSLGWTAVGGPVAAAAVLLWERDEVLVRRDGAGKRGKKCL